MDDEKKPNEQHPTQRLDNANEADAERTGTDTSIDSARHIPRPMPFAALPGGTQANADRERSGLPTSREYHLRRSNSEQSHTSKSRGRGRARLPEKLMEHLNADVAPGVLWWLPGNESFAIEASRVQTELLDVHFRGTKLSSFIRSLNRWGFRRIFLHSVPKSAICFKAKLFKKSAPQMVRQMQLSSYTPQSSGAMSEQSYHEDALPTIAHRQYPQPPPREPPIAISGGELTRITGSLVLGRQDNAGAPHESSAVLQRLAAELQQLTDTSTASPAQQTLTAQLQEQLARLSQPASRQENLLSQNQLGWNQRTMPRSSLDSRNSLLQAFLSQNAVAPQQLAPPPPPPPAPPQGISVLGETNVVIQLAQSLLSGGGSTNSPRYPQQISTSVNDSTWILQLLSNLGPPRQAIQQQHLMQEPHGEQSLQQQLLRLLNPQQSSAPQEPPGQQDLYQQLLQLLRQQQSRTPQEPPADSPGSAPQERRRFY